MKMALSLLFSALLLIAGGHDFEEERYLYSIDKTVTMRGHITFDDKGMEIDYSEPEVRRIVYDGLYMDVTDAQGATLQHLDLNEEPMMKVYMEFIHQLYRGDYKALRENFTITSSATVVRLTPIPPIDKVVKSVEVRRDKTMALQKIMTKMSNGDEITIHIAQ